MKPCYPQAVGKFIISNGKKKKTIETSLIVTEDGNLIMPQPHNLEPGKYQIVLVIDEKSLSEVSGRNTSDEFDEEELAEVLEVVAENRARMAAGFQPTQEELETSKIP